MGGQEAILPAREAFRWGVRAMKEAGIREPALDAAVLLGYIMGLDTVDVLAPKAPGLDVLEADRFKGLIDRRCCREPVSVILGQKEFYSLVFEVNSHVLTPRPETEHLVSEADVFLKSSSGNLLAADLGTGSGAVAIALAVQNPAVRFAAVDISPSALAVAGRNACRFGVQNRVSCLLSDMASSLRSGVFDLVVSNPPYVPSGEYGLLPPEVRRSEPACALVGGPLGTELHHCVVKQSVLILRPGGALMVEVGAGQDAEVAELFNLCGFESVSVIPDLAGIPRVVKGILSDV